MRLAVIGQNGCGKSTLLSILAGVEGADTGKISMPADSQLGYSQQEIAHLDLKTPVLPWVMEVLPSWGDFWHRFDEAVQKGDKTLLLELAREQAALEHSFGYNPEHRAKAVLTGLGFSLTDFSRPLQELSGGWRERAKLARILVGGADILLLDEPTNHLDLEAVEWLEDYLIHFEGALVFVAHDRVLLDRVATHVLFLGGVKPVVRKGGFTAFLSWMEETEEQRLREEQKIKDDIARKTDFVRKFQYKASKARQANSRKKQMEKLVRELEGIKPEEKQKTLRFSWPVPKRSSHTVLSALGVQMAYRDSPFLWKPLDFHVYAGEKIALVGANGCGKTTLLRGLMGEIPLGAGEVKIGSNVHIAYFSQHQGDLLNMEKTVLSEIRHLADPHTTEEELRSVLGLFLLGEPFWDRPIQALSGGEKNRLILASLFLKRANVLILDEPTNHLDLESREALTKALKTFEGTIIMVAHDRYFTQQVAKQVWWLKQDGIDVFHEGFASYDQARKNVLSQNQAEPLADKPAKNLSKTELKALKRREAEKRNTLHKALKPLQDEYSQLEQNLEKILTRQSVVEQHLADPKVYAEKEKSAKLMTDFAELGQKAEHIIDKMTDLESRIEALQAEK